ncbi:MAG TPA: ABC transporter ATP-binding protein [Rhizobiaceae bacterium]|nr:ABC transporter ATP-binding protein [Rhizobiaceae bacterium]
MLDLELRHISKRFGDHTAVDDVSLRVSKGEFACLVGPSGCGKTTTLRLIAGFDSVDSGSLLLDGVDIAGVPAHKRGIGVVFQSYALFPHKTIAENIGFGLKMRGRPRAEIDEAVRKALELVRLGRLGDRLPRQLSGGQQQRVALARALAFQPRLLLMDEPLSNLDAQLREEMRDEIKRVQREVGTTTVFVTHDQAEALAMADRVAVMSAGRLLQYDTPEAVYEKPTDRTVGRFIGKVNTLTGVVIGITDGIAELRTEEGLALRARCPDAAPGDSLTLMVRFERLGLSSERPNADNVVESKVERRTYLGESIEYVCRANGALLRATVPNRAAGPQFAVGDVAFIGWRMADAMAFAA